MAITHCRIREEFKIKLDLSAVADMPLGKELTLRNYLENSRLDQIGISPPETYYEFVRFARGMAELVRNPINSLVIMMRKADPSFEKRSQEIATDWDKIAQKTEQEYLTK